MAEEFNILNHEMVPKHTILSKEEEKEILDKFSIKPENLPKILINDPVVKEIGAKEGNVLKIVRKSKTAGTSLYYRIVIKK